MLKFIAIIFMTIDHIGYKFLYPSFFYYCARYIGRISFPLFSALLSYNFLYRSKNKIKYIKNLALFAFISELPFIIFIGGLQLNIFFQYLFSMLVFYFIEIKEEIIAFVLFFVFLIFSFFTDYGMLGYVFSLYMFFYYKAYYNNNLFLKFVFNFLLYLFLLVLIYFFSPGDFKFYSTVSLPIFLLLYYLPFIENNFHKEFWKNIIVKYKYLFYWYYPIHILILSILSILF